MSETKDSGDRRRKASVNKHGGKKNTVMCGECGLTVKDSDKADGRDVCECGSTSNVKKLQEEVGYITSCKMRRQKEHCKKGCAKLHKCIKRIEQQQQVEQMTKQNELEGKVNQLREFTAQEHDKNKEIEVRLGILEAKSVEIKDVLETNAKNDRGFENRLGTLEARTVGLEGKVDSGRATGSATEVKQEDNTGKPEPVDKLIELNAQLKEMENTLQVIAPQEVKPKHDRYERITAEYNLEGYDRIEQNLLNKGESMHRGDLETEKEYRRLNNQVRWETRSILKRKEQESAKNVKANLKVFWKYVQTKTRTKARIADLCKDEEKLQKTVNDQEKADVLSEQFSRVFIKEPDRGIPTANKKDVPALQHLEITEGKIRKVIKKLKRQKSPGPDGLYPRVIKEMMEELLQPLRILFESSFQEGNIPED
ncbi:hypothetical protein Hamer_G009566, partial [Homarus americanus]